MPILPLKLDVKLLKKVQEAEDVFSFYFEQPSDFAFLPGQFMRLTLDIIHPDERGNSRFFSIASSPTEKNYLLITIRIDRSRFKKTIYDLVLGTKLQITAPYGTFILKPEEKIPHIFLAGGIGITPFRSMIRNAADLNMTIPITLFTSFRTPENIIFQKELRSIMAKHPWFKLVETVTQPENSKLNWQGNTGRIDQNLIKKEAPDFSSSLFYIAGPPAMVDGMVDLVKTLGIEETKIRREKFTGY